MVSPPCLVTSVSYVHFDYKFPAPPEKWSIYQAWFLKKPFQGIGFLGTHLRELTALDDKNNEGK